MFIRSNKLRPCWIALGVCALAMCCAPSASAQISSNNPSQILQQYRNFRITWITNIWPYANTLFALLATIEFAWSAAVMALEKSDLQSWTSALIRKIMWLGAFYALLLYGRQWIPAIIDSFSQLGGAAAGISGNQGLAPSDVFMTGLNIAGALMGAASTSAFFTNPATSIAVMIAAALVVLGFTAITIQYIVAIVESYLVVSAGVIFLGFGGSRWTTPYVERYIGLGVSTGVKIMILYMLIAAGLNLSNGWLSEANGIGTSPNPSMTAFDVMGAGLIFMALCWQVPKLFAAVLGGSPALSGGDLVSTGTAVVGGATMVASVGASAIAAVAGATAAASGASGGAAIGGGAASRSLLGVGGTTAAGSVPPPSSLSVGSSGNGRPKSIGTSVAGGTTAVPPPTPSPASSESVRSLVASLGGESLAGSGFETQRPAAGFRSYSVPVAPRAQSASPGNSAGAGDQASVSAEPGGDSSQGASGSASESASSANAKPNPPAPKRREILASGAQRVERTFSGAAQRLRNAGPRFRGLPSDAAPHAQPPRMPIDHSE